MADGLNLLNPQTASQDFFTSMNPDLSLLPVPTPPRPAAAQRPAAVRPAAAPVPRAAAVKPAVAAPDDEAALKSDLTQMIREGYAAQKRYPEELGKYQRQTQANMAEYQAEHLKNLQMLDPKQIVRQEAPQMQDFAKQTSPLAMMLMAFGGKALGLSGQNMLGAMTGMVEGTSEGNLQKYNAAYKAWQDNYKQQREAYEDMKAYVAEMDKYAKDNVVLKNQIAQNALEMIGAQGEMAKSGINGLTALDRTQAQLAKANLDYLKTQSAIANRTANSRDRAIREFDKIQNASTRTVTAVNYLNRLKQLMPAVVAKYKDKVGVAPKTFGEIYVKLQDDPEVSEFQRLTMDLKSALIGLELPSGVRGNMYIEKVIGSTSPDLSTQNVSELSTAIAGMQAWAGNVKDVQDRQMKVWNQMAMSSGAPNMMEGVSDHTYQSPFNFQSANDVKKAVEEGTINREAGIQILREKFGMQ